jgi:hypothetical protein
MKLVLAAGPLMVLTFFYLIRSSWYIQKFILKLLLSKHLLIRQIVPKAVPESMLRLTDFTVWTLAGFRKPLVYCESGFQKPFHQACGGFTKTGITVNIFSASSAAYWKGLHINNWLTETR